MKEVFFDRKGNDDALEQFGTQFGTGSIPTGRRPVANIPQDQLDDLRVVDQRHDALTKIINCKHNTTICLSAPSQLLSALALRQRQVLQASFLR